MPPFRNLPPPRTLFLLSLKNYLKILPLILIFLCMFICIHPYLHRLHEPEHYYVFMRPLERSETENLIRRVGLILAWSVAVTAAWTVFRIELETLFRAERELRRMRVRIQLLLRQRQRERREMVERLVAGDLA